MFSASKGRKAEGEKNLTSRSPFERKRERERKAIGMSEGFARPRTRERIGETKREGGIMVVSLSRNDGQGRRGVTQDGSK